MPPPSSGDITQTVPAAPEQTLGALPFTGRAALGGGVEATITDVRGVTVQSHIPGDIGGASVQVTIRIVNGSSKPLGVDDVVVNATDSAGTPAAGVSTAPARPFRGAIAPGEQADGVYLFSIPVERRNPIQVTVDYAAGAPEARFTGSVQ